MTLLGMFQPWDVPSVLSTGSTGTRVLEGWVPLVVGTPGKSWQKPQVILGNLLQSLPAPFHQAETLRSATKEVSIISSVLIWGSSQSWATGEWGLRFIGPSHGKGN